MIIGVTGKSGAGKSTFAKTILRNCDYINIDSVAHMVMKYDDVKLKIKEVFGVDPDTTDKKVIGDLYFTNRDSKKEIDKLTWKYMEEIIDNIISSSTRDGNDVVLDWILLPHSKYWKMCDYKILIDTGYETRKKRVLERDGIKEEYFDKREKSSIEYNREDFDYIVTTK